LYFTYNGGPVFNLAGAKYAKAAAEPAPDASPQDSKEAGAPPATTSGNATPANTSGNADTADAAEYSRRGAALAARRDFDQALMALTRACEMAPDHPEYFYQRGMVYWQMRQGASAMADFDQALKLKPDDLSALVSRAQLLLQTGDNRRAAADLDAADGVASKQADTRFVMAEMYEHADLMGPAVAQYDLWIASHADDARVPAALNSRCWARALAGTDLPLALKDCNAALKRAAKSSGFYAKVSDTRGLVLLRMGEYDKSIADYDASLKINPKNAWSLYGRAIDELRKGKTSEGQAGIAAALDVWPQVEGAFNRRGIAP
jgi:tetratricopeptide (TPR) repeat protein